MEKNPDFRRSQLQFRLRLTFIVATLILLGIAYVTYVSSRALVASAADVDVTRTRIEFLERTLTTVVGAETGQRGYILTGDPAFLNDYYTAVRSIRDYLASVRRGADDDFESNETLRLAGQVDRKLTYLNESIVVRRSRGFAPAMHMIASKTGKKMMDEIRASVKSLQEHESADLAIRQHAAAHTANVAIATVAALVIVSLAGLLGSYLIVVRGMRRRVAAERQSADASEQLTRSFASLEAKSRDIRFLGEFSDNLQICFTPGEAYEAISVYVRELFPTSRGALGVFNNSRNLIDLVAQWNGAEQEPRFFSPLECHALRGGRTYERKCDSLKLACKHVDSPQKKNYVCIPLSAQGDTLGMLHMDFGGDPDASSRKNFAVLQALAERSALALANLNLREKLKSQSIRDPLTGLYNRRYMEESLERETHRAERQGRKVGVLMLDLDHFKTFNDTYGHEAGDRMLQEVGAILTSSFRREDVPCRYGGEELMVIMPDTSGEDLAARAEQVRERIKSLRLQHKGTFLSAVTVSIGAAVFPENGRGPQEIVSSADHALYAAKAQGRDRVVMARVAELQHCAAEESTQSIKENSPAVM